MVNQEREILKELYSYKNEVNNLKNKKLLS